MRDKEKNQILEHAAKFGFDEFKIYTGTRKVKFMKDGELKRTSVKRFLDMEPPKSKRKTKKAAKPKKPVEERFEAYLPDSVEVPKVAENEALSSSEATEEASDELQD